MFRPNDYEITTPLTKFHGCIIEIHESIVRKFFTVGLEAYDSVAQRRPDAAINSFRRSETQTGKPALQRTAVVRFHFRLFKSQTEIK